MNMTVKKLQLCGVSKATLGRLRGFNIARAIGPMSGLRSSGLSARSCELKV